MRLKARAGSNRSDSMRFRGSKTRACGREREARTSRTFNLMRLIGLTQDTVKNTVELELRVFTAGLQVQEVTFSRGTCDPSCSKVFVERLIKLGRRSRAIVLGTRQ